jgi:hypothetical protein
VSYYRLLLIVLKTFLTSGPIIVSAAITTTATKTRINAYSTIPWPFSFKANNIAFSSFPWDLYKK